jgi:hypothetical protein
MKFAFKLTAFLGFLIILIPSMICAKQWVKTYALAPYIGPEIYYMKRIKEGGAEQTGPLYGARIGYDYVRRYYFYWGLDALWATGTLDGHVRKEKLKSQFTDANVEARLGYTFQSKYWRCASFTPYTGVGYFWENNEYQHPSPLKIHFKNRFSYIPVGFLSQIFLMPNLSIGVNLKVRIIWEGEQHVKRDPEYDKLTQHYEEKLQYRVELPIATFFSWKQHSLGISLVPFYEYRRYGHRANFPFDFLETTLKLYGATLKILYLF